MPELDKNCTILIRGDGSPPPGINEIQKKLQDLSDVVKAKALEAVILAMIEGDSSYNRLLMTVIRFVVPSTCHRVKKLLQIYFEIVDKCSADGALKEEMILVCNALRNDLIHPNEYVRGSALRLLCKMRYAKILEPLSDDIMKNLTHRHSYVRRNAVMCVYAMVRSFGTESMPHATEEVEKLLLVEGDLSTKRNALLMLSHCDYQKAIDYVVSVQDVVASLGDIFQLVLLELLRKVCRLCPSQKGTFLRIIVNLLDTSTPCSPAVAYDGAASLVALSNAPVALKAGIQAYTTLLVEQADNNVRLIVLDRLADVMKNHKPILESFAMDIMRGLTCPSLEVRKKTLDIGLQLVSNRTINDIVNMLKKEIVRTMEEEHTGAANNGEYRKLLIRAVHAACIQFPTVAQSVMLLLMDFLGETDSCVTTEVAMLIRELSTFPALRPVILQRVIDSLGELQQHRVIRVCLWLVGEFCEDYELADQFISTLYSELKPLPFPTNEKGDEDGEGGARETAGGGGVGGEDFASTPNVPQGSTEQPKVVATRTVVLEDGTYGTEDVYEKPPEVGPSGDAEGSSRTSQIRVIIRSGDFLLSSVLSVAVTKLCLKRYRMSDSPSIDNLDIMTPVFPKVQNRPLSNAAINKSLFMVAALQSHARHSRYGGVGSDAHVRINQCTCALLEMLTVMNARHEGGKGGEGGDGAHTVEAIRDVLFPDGTAALKQVLEIEAASAEASYVCRPGADDFQETRQEVDSLLPFRPLRYRRGCTSTEDEKDDDTDIQLALGLAKGGANKDPKGSLFQKRLEKVQPMTGLADPVYVEAFVQVHHFDLVVELLVVNRTDGTLQNVCVELSTHGDLRLVDRPVATTLTAGESATVYASIKVRSMETGIIFGHVTFDKRSATDKECLVLNELHIDLLEYIQRSWVGEVQFRTMWSEFEWENKININTTITGVIEFLEHIMRNTHMTLVSKDAGPPIDKSQSEGASYIRDVKVLKAIATQQHFFTVNLYSKSIFGEDALSNVSIEKLPNGKLAGSVRIRSRTQGIALSLGDRITNVQRGVA